MVRFFFFLLLLFSFSYGDKLQSAADGDLLIKKIKSLISPSTFAKDRAYIDTIFSPKEDYFTSDGKINSLKVIKTLKENGVLNLFFKKPRDINITFKTQGEPQFFVKIMSDSLQNIGYYRYVTSESILSESEFIWKISLTSEYAADPLVLSQELKKSNCEIIDIIRENESDWAYIVDMKNARLDVSVLENTQEHRLKRSLYAYWVDVSKIDKLQISSSARNEWYPYIAYYDKFLRLIRVEKIDEKTTNISLHCGQGTHYIKISDIYTLKNIKDDLVLMPTSKKSE
ncbi:MAG: hypothetical protein A2540_06115 [Sulfurimonas sp. RIFOXYD2_FULL_37_8]|jgi:hypothetical protein|nr:MAG: hypothetical protein A2540_06115 [Sulfurimonas sp. RIFOXYD2_FULL_37_8]